MGKGGMDYKGQKLSEQIYLVLIPAVGSVAWVFGYLAQDFKQTFYGCDLGVPRRCLHTMRRLRETRSWVVSFFISRPFGPRRPAQVARGFGPGHAHLRARLAHFQPKSHSLVGGNSLGAQANGGR